MLVQLKQPAIEQALKAYITGLGIDLSGKTFTITFTSGRKDNGLSADIEFEDAAPIPGYSDGTALTAVPTPSPPQQAKPALTYPVGVCGGLDLPVPSQAARPWTVTPIPEESTSIGPEDMPEPAVTKLTSLFSK